MKKSLAITLLTLVAVVSLSLFTGCIGLHTHSVVKVEGVSATCTEDGNIEYYYCEGCGKYFSDQSFNEISKEQTVLKALGHTYEGEGTVVDATCTEDGSITKHCSVCDKDFVEVIPATGHTESDWIVDEDATCTEDGSKHKECTVCHDTLETAEIPVKDHDLEDHEGKDPTCVDVGWEAYKTCKNCNYTTYKEITATGHTESDWIEDTKATCEETGSKHKECIVCHDTLETEEIPAKGHDLEDHEGKDPTCADVGWEAYKTCKNCDYTTYKEIPATGEHSFSEGCCSVCGKPVGDDLVFGGEGAYTDSWYYWNDRNWCGSNVIIKYAVIDNGTIKLSYTSEGFCWYGMQLFYKNTSLENGKKYTLTLKINSSVEGYITVNGNVVLLKEGDNAVSVEYTEGEKSSVSVQFGKYKDAMITAGDFVISDVDFEEVNNAIANGAQTDAVANPDKWIYWNDQWWCGSNVTVTNAVFDNDTINLSYTSENSEDFCWFGMQLFYKDSTLTAGNKYTLTLKISSSVVGKITVNGTVIDLIVGDNEVKVNYTEVADLASISIQFGTEDPKTMITAGEFVISDISITEYVEEGGETVEPITNGAQTDAVANPDKWIYWNDQWWCGSNVTVTSAVLDNDTINLSYTSENSEDFCWFALQLFYKDSTLTAGDKYTLTLKINSSVAGKITVNGTVIDLIVGDNEVKVNYTEVADLASISIQFGTEDPKTMVTAGEFVISDISITEYVEEGGSSGEGEGSGSDEGDEAVTLDLEFVMVYNDHYFHFEVTTSYDMTKRDYVIVNGVNRDCEVTANGNDRYTLKFFGADNVPAGEYTFVWMYAGKAVAKATYTYSPETSGEGEGSGEEVTFNFAFVTVYNANYFHFTVETTYDMTKVDYVVVNGTNRDCEVTANGDNKYTLKFFGADNVPAGEYTFVWMYAGKAVAELTYTYSPETSGEGGGEGSGEETGDVAIVTFGDVLAYNDCFFQMKATCDYNINDADSVRVIKGEQSVISIHWEPLNYESGYFFNIHVGGNYEAGEYTFEWIKDGNVVAKGSYTYGG